VGTNPSVETTAAPPKDLAAPVAIAQFKKPEAVLSAEQQKQWNQGDFERWSLLDFRDTPPMGLTTCLVPLPDGKDFITAGSKVALWSLGSQAPAHVFLEKVGAKEDDFVRCMALSPNGNWFATGDSAGWLRLWSLKDRKEIVSAQISNTGIVDLAIDPTGQEIATIGFTSEVSIWAARNLEKKSRFKVDTNGVKRILYLAGGSLVAAGETTSGWGTASGKLQKKISSGRYYTTLAHSPDRKRWAFGQQGTLQLVIVANDDVYGEEAPRALDGEISSDELAVFSTDGSWLATANGAEVRLWDLASNRLMQVLGATGRPVTAMGWLPQFQALVIANDDGCVRVWGTATSAQLLGMKPLQAKPQSPGPERTPAYSAQFWDVIDFRSFPRMPGSKLMTLGPENLSCTVSSTADEAKLFYRHHLGQRGWLESTETSVNPAAIEFQKDGFRIDASFYPADESNTMVNLNHAGNYDLRWTPKLDVAPVELTFENAATVLYRTKADVIQIETNLLRKLHAAGWIPYLRLHTSKNEQADRRDLDFVRHGMTLHVSISRGPNDPDFQMVQYGTSLTEHGLPVPSDAGFVEFDGSNRPSLVAATTLSLPDAVAFYDSEMKKQGWIEAKRGRVIREKQAWLPYFQGQKDVLIGLVQTPDSKTLVRVGEDLEKASWQVRRWVPAQPEAKPTETMEAADFPILGASQAAQYDARAKTIEFRMDSASLASMADRYAKELETRGWSLEKGGVRSDEYTLLNFKKGKAELDIRARSQAGHALMNIQGDGLAWNKPLPGAKKIQSFASWLHDHGHPASLELLDQFEKEMRAILPKP
jgi:WD40 repeat protein